MVQAINSPKPAAVHPGSLVERSAHCPALLEFLETHVGVPVVDYIVNSVIETVHVAFAYSSVEPSRKKLSQEEKRANLFRFVARMIKLADMKMPTVLVALVYIERAKDCLRIATEELAYERVFLGALMTASKYTQDSCLRNTHWAICTGFWSIRDVGHIEREFLDVLDFELSFTEDDILSHYAPLTAAAQQTRPSRLSRLSSHLPRLSTTPSVPTSSVPTPSLTHGNSLKRSVTTSSSGSSGSRYSSDLPRSSSGSSESSSVSTPAEEDITAAHSQPSAAHRWLPIPLSFPRSRSHTLSTKLSMKLLARKRSNLAPEPFSKSTGSQDQEQIDPHAVPVHSPLSSAFRLFTSLAHFH